MSGDGIVVNADLAAIKKAAERVIFDPAEEWYGVHGERVSPKAELEEGEQIVFREKIDICPAVIVAAKLGDSLWYVVTSAECPDVKCDDDQAMKCVRLNEQNMRIFQDTIIRDTDGEWAKQWSISASDHPRVQRIIDKASKRWTH
ncbi:MAG: hypothetical protein JSW05_06375 [Candidatus Thorarchaeota archaeon]|nr:MAG: hypothetical protein JSW05_06375 [Candidatus Thorarchaeota archaeon]